MRGLFDPPHQIEVPLRSGETYLLSEVQIVGWEKAYPNLNVRQEITQMIEWCKANPRLKKTERGAPRFIVAWLKRASERNGGTAKAGPPRDALGQVHLTEIDHSRSDDIEGYQEWIKAEVRSRWDALSGQERRAAVEKASGAISPLARRLGWAPETITETARANAKDRLGRGLPSFWEWRKGVSGASGHGEG